MRKVALFFGSFNPIHIGHLAIGNFIAEFTGVDEVRFVVSPHNPLKNNEELLDDTIRLQMLRDSVKGFSKFQVSDVELFLPRPSYTFRTLEVLSANEPDTQFSLIIGGDNLGIFRQWKNYQWIADNFSVFVYPRLASDNKIPDDFVNFKLIDAPVMEISSTFIRQSIQAGKDIRYFLPEPAYRIIEEHHLYRYG